MIIVGANAGLSEDLKAAKIGVLIENTGGLPSMPKIAQRMMALLQDPDVVPAQVESLLQMDAGLSSQIMRIVNSSFYGLSRRIVDLRHAISMLGLNEIRNLVLATASRSLYKRFGPDEHRLWQHSLRSAIVARLVATVFAPVRKEVAFLVGQMHDVGTILLQSHLENARVRMSSSDEDADRAAELEALGFSHTDIGALLMEKWNMPREIEVAAFFHHDMEMATSLEPEMQDVVAVTVIADCVTRPSAIELGSKQLPVALEVLGLEQKRFAQLAEHWRSQALAESGVFDA